MTKTIYEKNPFPIICTDAYSRYDGKRVRFRPASTGVLWIKGTFFVAYDNSRISIEYGQHIEGSEIVFLEAHLSQEAVDVIEPCSEPGIDFEILKFVVLTSVTK